MANDSAISEFAAAGLDRRLLAVLEAQGIKAPFPVQSATWAPVIAGDDLTVQAPTGSGKTLAFGLGLLTTLVQANPKRPRGLVLAPTRELADQIARELRPYAAAVDRRLVKIYGGVGSGPQISALEKGVDLVVATPGRLLDLIDQGSLALDAVTVVVIDEADRMADMGFLPDVAQLLDLTNPRRQTLLFSATLGPDVAQLRDLYQRDPILVEIDAQLSQPEAITHRFIATDKMGKVGLAAKLIAEHGATMVFCRTRHGVDRVARQLRQAGVGAGWIHGGRTQTQREAALHAFTTGKVKALVATDVAARGIHVDDVACVIHLDPPEDLDTYVHRSGRTGRAGAGGMVISFVNGDQVKSTLRLQRDLGLPEGIEDPEDQPDKDEWTTSRVGPTDKQGKKPRGRRPGKRERARRQTNQD